MIRAALALALALGGCSQSPPRDQAATLDGTLVARVEGEGVASSSVARVAAAQGVSPRDATDLLVSDALFAAEAKARGVPAQRAAQLRSPLAAALFARYAEEARREGPATKAELDAYAKDRWLEVARPESRAAVHVVVRVGEGDDEGKLQRASALADALRVSVAEVARTAAEVEGPDLMPRGGPDRTRLDPVASSFYEAVDRVATGDLAIVREQLPPIGVDGLTIQATGRAKMDPAFVAALDKLERRGDLSPVVRGENGFHVILLLAHYPAQMLDEAALRERFQDIVYASRAKTKVDALLDDLRAKSAVEIDPAADNLMGLVEIKP